MTDFELMGAALDEARKAAALGEVPVGAVVARNGQIVAAAHNTRETEKNALHHAELLAIDAACKALGGWRLWECELFVTLEPCPMCAGAILNSRIRRVVYGAADAKAGCCGSVTDLFALPFNHHPVVESGLRAEEAQALTRLIDSLPGVALTGCFTHMATADEPDPTGTLRQIERFEALCKAVKAAHPGEIICHGANTASIFRYPQLHADMVRGGLALYGYPPVPEATGLQPAMRWVTRGIYVKTIAPGDRVSYGGTFEATRPTVVMTLPVGYADGYRRGISGKGCVLVRGRRAPILGRVCMDQMMVDVTDIPGAREGDEAVLLGRQGEEQIDAEEMAAWLDTISYEVLCSPSKRVPRVYINA